jgi:hypothetical protein
MFLLVRMNVVRGIGLGLVLSGGSVLYAALSGANFWGTEWYASIHYTAMFITGALLAKHRERLKSTLQKMGPKARRILSLKGLLLYIYAHPSFLLHKVNDGLNPYYRTVVDTWLCGWGLHVHRRRDEQRGDEQACADAGRPARPRLRRREACRVCCI